MSFRRVRLRGTRPTYFRAEESAYAEPTLRKDARRPGAAERTRRSYLSPGVSWSLTSAPSASPLTELNGPVMI